MNSTGLPIRLYGDPILRQQAAPIEEGAFDEAATIAEALFASLEKAGGLGLAAPQIGISKRIFVIDTHALAEADKAPLIQCAFVNPKFLEKSADTAEYEEGCLSIPGLHEAITRPASIQLRYQTPDQHMHQKRFDGWVARIIQHEYDHIEGILFLDHLSQLKKQLLKKKLQRIVRGDVATDYPVQAWNS